MHLSRGLLLIYLAGFLRSLGVGLLGVVLAVYLSRAGIGTTRIGLVIGTGLLGACLATSVVAWAGRRIGYRASLVSLSLLAALGGVGLAALPSFPPAILCKRQSILVPSEQFRMSIALTIAIITMQICTLSHCKTEQGDARWSFTFLQRLAPLEVIRCPEETNSDREGAEFVSS